MFKVNKRNTRTRCETCLKFTIKSHSGVFTVNFEHISFTLCSVSIVNFEQVNADWVVIYSKQHGDGESATIIHKDFVCQHDGHPKAYRKTAQPARNISQKLRRHK